MKYRKMLTSMNTSNPTLANVTVNVRNIEMSECPICKSSEKKKA